MEKIKLNRIDASLKYGQFFTGKWLIFLYSLIGCCCVMPISTVVFSFLVLFGKEVYDTDTIIVLIGSNSISILVMFGTIYVLYKNNKLKKKIILWLSDAVQLTAQTTTLDRFRTFGHPVAETKLQVEFCIDNYRKICTSEDESKKDHWYKRNGFFKILSKYADKKITIMYSPKYDQVLILKN